MVLYTFCLWVNFQFWTHNNNCLTAWIDIDCIHFICRMFLFVNKLTFDQHNRKTVDMQLKQQSARKHLNFEENLYSRWRWAFLSHCCAHCSVAGIGVHSAGKKQSENWRINRTDHFLYATAPMIGIFSASASDHKQWHIILELSTTKVCCSAFDFLNLDVFFIEWHVMCLMSCSFVFVSIDDNIYDIANYLFTVNIVYKVKKSLKANIKNHWKKLKVNTTKNEH